MEMKENTDLTGKLCKFRNINVLIVGMCEKKLKFSKNLNSYIDEYTRYYALFPNGGVDIVSAKSLKLIS